MNWLRGLLDLASILRSIRDWLRGRAQVAQAEKEDDAKVAEMDAARDTAADADSVSWERDSDNRGRDVDR
jgi:hypothetical protein